MKRKRTRNCVKTNKMPKKVSKVKKLIKKSVSAVPKCEKKTYCLFCYKLVNYNNMNHLSRTPNQDKENERVQTCDNFYNHLLRNNAGKDETDKHSSFSFVQIQQMCLGACNDCFYVINMCCTVFKEIEDLQSSLKASLKTLRNVMGEAGKVTARMKLFRESFALATAHKKKGKRKRKGDLTGPKKSLQEVLEFRQTIFETCLLDRDTNESKKNWKPDIQISAESKPSDLDQLSDNEIKKQPSPVGPPEEPKATSTSTTSPKNAESVEDKDDSDIEILNVIKTEVEEMTLDLHPSFYTEDNVMNDTDENSASMLKMTEGESFAENCRFKCIKCEKTFSTEDQLINHASSHFYTEVNVQTTDECHAKNDPSSIHPVINYDDYDESTEIPVESNENDELFSCMFCSFTTDQISILVEHETTLHTLIGEAEPENNVVDEVRCPRCLNFLSIKSRNRKQNLRRHYINCHMEKKCSAKCEDCNAIFKACNIKEANLRLNRHYQRIHSAGRTKELACKICDKRFYCENNLKQHMVSHAGKRFGCPICEVKFSTKYSEMRHKKRCHQQFD